MTTNNFRKDDNERNEKNEERRNEANLVKVLISVRVESWMSTSVEPRRTMREA